MEAENINTETDPSKPLLIPTLPRWWRVLPSVMLIIVISTIDSLILNDYIEYRYVNQYQSNSSSTQNSRDLCLNESSSSHSTTSSVSTTTSRYSTSTTISPDDLVQQSTARLNVYISLAATIPSVLTSILLGANCDRTGRKALIVLPFVGKIIRYAVLTAVVYFELSDLWIILSILFDGIFGTAGLAILSGFAFISDCTTKKNRTVGIIVMEVCMCGIKFVPLLAMGTYLENPNFIQSMLITFGISIAGFLFSVFLQPESNPNVQHLNFLQQLRRIRLREIAKVPRVFLAKRQDHKQRSLWLLVSAHISLVIMLLGYLSISYLYMYGAPFCFDSFRVSLTNIAQTLAMIVFLIPCTLTVMKRTDHVFLSALGCVTFIIQMVLFAIATEVWMIYVAVCIGALFFVLAPVVRSQITKLVGPTEYGTVFIPGSIVESGGYFAISAMGNEIYQATLLFYPGLVFLVFALFGVLAILLVM